MSTARHAGPALIYRSAAMRRAIADIDRFAPTRLSVLLVGETGTGKELLAQRLHRQSGRGGELVDVNCGALPREMVEGLLFGHARGAFTGAVANSKGLVSLADGGTLFLDELSSLPTDSQTKLLRVLETGEVRPLGSGSKLRADFRVVSAAQSDPGSLAAQSHFRQDLYYRIAGAVIQLPALRDRPEDIIPLAHHFAARHQRELDTDAEKLLLKYAWPGNVRELHLVIERASFGGGQTVIRPTEIREALCQTLARRPGEIVDLGRDDAEAARLIALCATCDWSPDRVATALGVSRATMYRRLRSHGVRLRAAAPA